MATAARGRKKASSATSTGKLDSTNGHDNVGLKKLKSEHRNLSVPTLIEAAVARDEGYLADNGALVVLTGKFTGRSPKDKFTADQNPSTKDIWWGPINQKISPANWDKIFKRVMSYLEGKEVFIFDGFVGQDPRYKLPVRVISEQAWHSLFCKTLFVRPTKAELKNHKSQFTIIDVGRFLG